MKKLLVAGLLTLLVIFQPYGNIVRATGEPVQVDEWVIITFNGGANGSLTGTASFKVLKGSTWSSSNIAVPRVRVDSGYTFSHWSPDFPLEDAVITENMTFTAFYTSIGGGNDIQNNVNGVDSGNENNTSGSIAMDDPNVVVIPEDEVPAERFQVKHTTPWWAYTLIGVGVVGLLCILTILVKKQKDEEKEEIRQRQQ